MKTKHLFRAMSLLILLVSFFPTQTAGALDSTSTPPADMFQLPWDQGGAWMAIDGLDNGTRRPLESSHQYTVGRRHRLCSAQGYEGRGEHLELLGHSCWRPGR